MKNYITKAICAFIVLTMAFTASVFAISATSTASTATTNDNNEAVNTATTNDSNEAVNTTATVKHECKIVRANEHYHIFDCDECENYSRVYHDEMENSKPTTKNEFFHEYRCVCGYAYTVEHNFEVEYDILVDPAHHFKKCADCDYKKAAEAHDFTNDFYGNYHDIACEDCDLVAAHHVGVAYTYIDKYSCQATCSCGVTEIIEHDWDGFTCDNCNYSMSGDTYAVVKRVIRYEDGCYIRFVSDNGTHRVDMLDTTLSEGDFVKIIHYGNDIFDITVLVDGDIVNDEENFNNYIYSDEIIEKSLELEFEDLVIEEIEYLDEEYVNILFESGNRSMGFKADGYVVYDLLDCGISDLEEDFAYLTFCVGDMVYFICFW